MAQTCKSPSLPTEKAYTALTILAGAFLVVLLWLDLKFLIAQSFARFALDPSGYAIGHDFLNTWMGGRMAFFGALAPWFDYNTYTAALRTITGHANYPLHFWSYPPHLLLFTWPLGLLPYLPAFGLWCIGGLALYLLAARACGIERQHFWFLAVAPAVTVNAFYGQNGLLTAALLIGGLANLDRRPTWAGILFGILTIKPQFGLLLPVMLVLTSRWRVIASTIATTAVLIALTAIWFGPDIWLQYLRKVTPQQSWLLYQAGKHGWPFVSSVFVSARLAGLSVGWAWAAQALASAGALAAVVWTFWRSRDPGLSLALLITATFLFSPWMNSYDMPVLAIVVASVRDRPDNRAIDHGLALAVWVLPFAMWLLGADHIPTAMLVLPAFAARLLWRLHCGERRMDERTAASVAITPVSVPAE